MNDMNRVLVDLRDRRFEGDTEWLASYLGVPVNTARNWINGIRTPPAVLHRLVEVLGTVEAMAPDLHDALVPGRPPPKQPVGRPRVRIG